VRWPAIAVAAVLLLDLIAIWRWYDSPGMVVSRAALATVQAGACREALIVRTGGQDRLVVVDARSTARGPVVAIGQVIYVGGRLSDGSAADVAAGRDLQTQVPTAGAAAAPSLARGYTQAVQARASWIAGPCMPLEDPLAAGLRPSGVVRWQDGVYRVFQGLVVYRRGPLAQLPRAAVRIGITPNGRLAFEALAQESASGRVQAAEAETGLSGLDAPLQVFVRFLPAAAPLDGLGAAARRTTYDRLYQQLLGAWPALAPAAEAALPGF
jgi:hypothetical protein